MFGIVPSGACLGSDAMMNVGHDGMPSGIQSGRSKCSGECINSI